MTSRIVAALLLASAAALAAPAGADTVRANSTTLFTARQDLRGLTSTETVAPLYQLVSVTASDVTTGIAEEVEIALSTWGALDLGPDLRDWHNGAPGAGRRLSGDVDVGYVKGELLSRRLVLRVGRQMVADGNARMVHLDGGQFRLRLPGNFGLSAYVGSPVPPRFAARGGALLTGNRRANFATGGRVSWFWPGLMEVGASVGIANDRGDEARQDVGADLRLFLPANVQLVTAGFFSLLEERIGETEVSANWRPMRRLKLTLDYRHVEPDLFLERTSILSVFSDTERNEVGGGVGFEALRTISLDATYHALLEDRGDGHRARLRTTWRPRTTTDAGVEGVYLNHPDGAGYFLARLFGAQRIRMFEVTADLLGTIFDRTVNQEDYSLVATATAAWRFAPGWKALLAGSGGTTPFFERHFDVLAKLVYDQTYVAREVP